MDLLSKLIGVQEKHNEVDISNANSWNFAVVKKVVKFLIVFPTVHTSESLGID